MAMVREFKIPSKLEDLEDIDENFYSVQSPLDAKNMSEKAMTARLDDIAYRLQAAAHDIVEPDNFDGLYGLVRCHSSLSFSLSPTDFLSAIFLLSLCLSSSFETLGFRLQSEVVSTLTNGLSSTLLSISGVLNHKNANRDADKVSRRNAIKM